jgi:hypothetical protein
MEKRDSMTVPQAAKTLQFEILCQGDDPLREIKSVYCCDLLSFVMGRAPSGSAWVTVMGNVNAVAVAMLADVACIVLAENAALDEMAASKAIQNGVPVLRSTAPIFETALAIAQSIKS